MFNSGFALIKVGGYSYICKIISRHDGLYDIVIDDYIFTDVPEKELISVRGDEEEYRENKS